MMGGMQFQAEHHLFPQIPFYRLPDAVPIIKEELAKLNKSIMYGPVIWIIGKPESKSCMIKGNLYFKRDFVGILRLWI